MQSPRTTLSTNSRPALAALLATIGPLLGLIAVWTLFALLTPGGAFISWENQRLMLLQTAVVGTAAIGATLIIIAGGIDLSVGASIALGTVVVGLLLQAGATATVAALGAIAASLLIGAAIGTMVVIDTAPPSSSMTYSLVCDQTDGSVHVPVSRIAAIRLSG